MITSGETPKATTDNDAIILIPKNQQLHQHLQIVNEGTVAGFFSVDSGGTFARLSAGGTLTLEQIGIVNRDVLVKREFDGSDLTDLFGHMW